MAQTAKITVYAAGSLRAALSDIAAAFEAAPGGGPVRLVFGASGLLKDRLQTGESADVFASANLEHPEALAASGRAGPVRPFARNALCALAAPSFALGGQTLAQRLLDDRVKLGTSTPKADPSGDYAFRMFERIEASAAAPAGAADRLKAKALQLTGGPDSPRPPGNRNVYGVLVAGGQADVFITYCTNAEIARQEQPQLQVLPIPENINVSATYGLTMLRPASAGAQRFVDYLLGAPGQQRLKAYGFVAP
jgi:ABC-type molybdate transport system substrate-binding protein